MEDTQKSDMPRLPNTLSGRDSSWDLREPLPNSGPFASSGKALRERCLRRRNAFSARTDRFGFLGQQFLDSEGTIRASEAVCRWTAREEGDRRLLLAMASLRKGKRIAAA